MKNPYFKLPFQFDEAMLLSDLAICETYNFTPHFNSSNYTGSWKSISLRSVNGEINTIYAHDTNSKKYQDTPLLAKCSYFTKIVNSFQCEKESIRLLSLQPGSKIKEHTDYNLGYEDGIFRIHIPISTNTEVLFKINNEPIKMKMGECWYGNFNLPHLVENNGSIDRVNLVMDCLRNEWSDALFLKCGYDFNYQKEPTYSKETKLQMIAQLKLMQTDTSEYMIAQLLKELE